jgi:hypothetical protein
MCACLCSRERSTSHSPRRARCTTPRVARCCCAGARTQSRDRGDKAFVSCGAHGVCRAGITASPLMASAAPHRVSRALRCLASAATPAPCRRLGSCVLRVVSASVERRRALRAPRRVGLAAAQGLTALAAPCVPRGDTAMEAISRVGYAWRGTLAPRGRRRQPRRWASVEWASSQQQETRRAARASMSPSRARHWDRRTMAASVHRLWICTCPPTVGADGRSRTGGRTTRVEAIRAGAAGSDCSAIRMAS